MGTLHENLIGFVVAVNVKSPSKHSLKWNCIRLLG